MRLISLLSAVLIAGCVQPVKYERPAVELPEAWKETAPRFAEDGRWWRIYDDALLDAVVDESLSRNGDLLIAAARVDQARGLVGEANSFFWPSVDLQAGISRQQVSTRTAQSFPGFPSEFTNHRAVLNVSYALPISSAACAPTPPLRAPSSSRARPRATRYASRSPRRSPGPTSRCARSTSRWISPAGTWSCASRRSSCKGGGCRAA